MATTPGTLQLLTNYVFNTTPNSTVAAYGANAGEGGIWMSGGGLSVDANTNLYFEVGNGVFTATNNSGGTEFGDSFMKLSTTNGLAVADYFTPWNQQTLANNDTDVGSGGLLLLPDQPGPFPHLLLGAGKEGKIYLINRDQMTTNNNHYDSSGTVDFVRQTVAGQVVGGSFDTPAYFNGSIYYAGSGDRLKSFTLSTNGLLSTSPSSTGPRTYGSPGATPSVSANGTNATVAGDLADPDNDGAPNLVEYALASDPNTPNPGGSLTGDIAGNQFQVQFNRNSLATNVSYVVQAATSLDGTWTDLMTFTAATGWVANTVGTTASESLPLIVAPDHFVVVTVTDPSSVSSTTSRFFRVCVHL